MAFPPLPDRTADQLEQDLLARWASESLFRRTLDANRGGTPYVFYEGPPTANGRPGIHHVFSRTVKDLICRFHAMRGQSVTRIAGWDTHGLPVEIEVERELQLTGKQDIERFGVEEFNARARASVFKYQSEWESLSDRIGYWLDYEHPYVTCSNPYVETVWWLLRRIYERGLLSRGHRVLPYCPRCGTVLSSHELALGYEEVTTNSAYLTFPLADQPSRQLLVWTTTPWTLLSNVAVAVHPDLEYGEYQVGERTIILATARASLPSGSGKGAPTFAELGPVRTFRGRELIGLRYRRPLEVVPLPEDRATRVIVGGSFVTAEDGSGLVHLAPAFGADDYQAGMEHNLALVRPVAADGTFTGVEWPELEGRLVTAKETNDRIIRRLKEDGRWHLTSPHTHTYPHCWRCASPLIYYARDSWFIRTSEVKERMLELNRGVDWHPPEVGAGRFGEWLEHNVDWALSRDRYWGTPLPVWLCDRDPAHVEVVGSYAQLAERWGRPLPDAFDPHKPHIDGYAWSCSCGGTLRRTPEVIDTWFDSGAMPYAQWHYPFEHANEFAAHFPADFICEGVDQTRGWFYSLLAIATAAFDAPAYRHVIVNELVLDATGQKMSKTKGNAVDPWEVIAEHGADSVRLYLLGSSQVWLPKRFDTRTISEVVGAFVNRLRNTYAFLAEYAGDWTSAETPPVDQRRLVDRWLVSRLDATIGAVTAAWEGYDPTAGLRELMGFVDDLSNWYVRVNRSRFWAVDSVAEPAALATLYEALVAASRMLAPAAPFLSDWLHRGLTGGSVHLARFPTPGDRRDCQLEAAMTAVRKLASLARYAREDRNLRVRQPLATMRVAVPSAVRGAAFDELLGLLLLEVNVKAVEVVAADTDLVRLRPKANFRTLGQRYGKRTPFIAGAAARLGQDQLREMEQGGTATLEVEGETVTFLPEEVAVEREVVTDWPLRSEGPYVVALDPTLTPELRREGTAREVVNRIQRLRKEAGFRYTDRIGLWVDGDAAVIEAIKGHAEFIAGETLARRVELQRRCPSPELEQEVALDGYRMVVGLRRYRAGHAGADPQPPDGE